MKKTSLIFLLFITILIFAEEKISEKKIEIKDDQSYEMIEKLPHSELSSMKTLHYKELRGYNNIALGFAQIGDFKAALKYAEKIEQQQDKDDCYSKIVCEMVASGLDDKALETVKKIKEEHYIQQSYKEIIESVIENDHEYKKAMLYANKYQDENSISVTKLFIISDMLNNGKTEEAIEFYVNNNSEEESKNIIFRQATTIYIKQNDLEGLNNFMKKVNIPMKDEYKEWIISHATYMNKTYLIEGMVETLNDEAKDRVYTKLAIKLIRKYKYSEAYEILAKIQDVGNQDRVYFQFAQNYTKDGNINRALSYADTMSTIKMRDKLYDECIRSLLIFGDIDKAISLLHKTNDISTKEKKASDIAIRLFINGEMEKYQEIIETISEVKILDKMYRRIIIKLLPRNKYEQIEEYLEKITDSFVKDNALDRIAETYSRSNDFEKAQEYAERIINDDIRNRVLDKIKK